MDLVVLFAGRCIDLRTRPRHSFLGHSALHRASRRRMSRASKASKAASGGGGGGGASGSAASAAASGGSSSGGSCAGNLVLVLPFPNLALMALHLARFSAFIEDPHCAGVVLKPSELAARGCPALRYAGHN